MTTDAEIYDKLLAPFPSSEVHWRVGATNGDKTSGIPLAYIDARNVMNRLDEVVGFDCWQDAYSETNSGIILCALAVMINGNWVTKSDGAGRTDVEAEKGGVSDAFKRAAVKFGVGRYLYALGNQWVPIKQKGKSFVLVNTPVLPDWALPADERGKKGNSTKTTPVATQFFGDNNDTKASIITMLSKLEELKGEEETQCVWQTILKHNTDGAMKLGDVASKDLAAVESALKDTIQATEAIENKKEEEHHEGN